MSAEGKTMGLINWIFDFYQQYRIDELRRDTSRYQAETNIRGTTGGVDAERLERALGELALAVKTVQRVMVDKGICSAEEFRASVAKIDLEDGRVDGRAPVG
jgi:hypothetical protein